MGISEERIDCMVQTACKTLVLAVAIATCLPTQGLAVEPATPREVVVSFNITAGDLSAALENFSTQSGVQAIYRQELVAGKRTNALIGSLAPSIALARLLSGTGLVVERVNEKTYVLKAEQSKTKAAGRRQEKKVSTSVDRETHGEVKELGEVVVVGSRLGVSPVDSAMPIQVITREQIDRSGSGNIAQVLSYLSEISVNSNGDRQIGVGDGLQSGANTNATTVQMRGMPRGTTLVLINGRRAGDSATYSDTGQFDLSTIPLSLVERIEVLPAGSSAIYGGDGLAGVINVVLRRDANGIEMRYRKSHAAGYATSQGSILWGKTWGRGDLTVAANWNEEDSLYSRERSLTANQDYTRFGGRDWRADSSNPATVYSLAGCPDAPSLCFLDLSERGNLPGLASPVAVVPAESNGIGLTPADFLATQGQVNLSSYHRHLRSAEENFGLTMNGRVDLGASVEGFAEFAYTKRKVPAFEMPLTTILPNWGYSYSRVPAANPFNPFGVDVAVGFNFVKTGVFTTYEQEYSRGALGIRGKQKKFDWEMSGWQSQDKGSTHGAMYFDADLVGAAINSTDPAKALNPFVSNGEAPGSPELMRSLIRVLDGTSQSKNTGITGYIRGRPLKVPAGEVTALIGAEYQRQSLNIATNNTTASVKHTDGTTSSSAYFAEARVPILSPRQGTPWERIALTAALRRESSTRFESDATTETVGLEVRPTNALLFRSTYSTAFRPLLNYFAVLEPRIGSTEITDPFFGGTDYYQVRVIQRGGAPDDLRPESSKNSTVGLVYRPASDWSMSITHWDMEFTDRIAFVSIQSLVDEEDRRPGRVTRNPDTRLIEEVDGRQVNIALMSAAGIDLAFDANWSSSIGEVTTSLAATYTYEHQQKSTKDAPAENGLAQLNSNGWAPRWKIVPRVSLQHGALSAFLTGRYVSKYKDSLTYQSGPRAGDIRELGDFWMFDLNLNLSVGKYFKQNAILSGSNINIGATNLFNRLPDNCFGCYDTGYDASQYDIMGRTVYAELRLNF